MAFAFQYARILKLREDDEQFKKSELAKSQQRRVLAQEALQKLINEKTDFDQERASRLSDGVKASDLVWFRDSEQWFIETIELSKGQLRQAELEVINARVALVKATQERKKFEKLKELALNRFIEVEAVREANMIDGIVTYQSAKNKKGAES